MARFVLQDRVALVTGASSGIGEATAIVLAERGALPVLVARRKGELQRVADHIRERTGKSPLVFAADIADESDRRALVHFLEREVSALHVLVHNAGITAHGRFDESSPVVLRKTMELNFFAVAESTAALLPLLKRTSGERLIALVSTPSGLYGVPGRFAYSASKAAGHALMETMRMELAADRISCTIFCPGYTRTALRTSGLAADGAVLAEEQATGAREPRDVALRLVRAIERRERLVLLGMNGRLLFWGRTLFPRLLERLMSHKLRADFAPGSATDR